jgi:predicted RND superfamily exporter protein
MSAGRSLVGLSLDHPKLVTAVIVAATLALGALIPMVKVDTDPENMLAETEAVRVFHNAMKREFTLYDMVVVGLVNEKDPDGVFNPTSLARIHELTEFAKGISWPDPHDPEKEVRPVVEFDLLAPSTVDDIRPAGGAVHLEWLMAEPPKTREAARAIRARAKENPLLDGTLVSEDGKAVCIYLPLTDKHHSYRVYSALKDKIATFTGDEQYHITGLPVAEDTFGVQMFIQMAISAPLAMLVIFILMWLFFRKLVLIISPMIVAMVSVICTMGLLIGTGHTVHIIGSAGDEHEGDGRAVQPDALHLADLGGGLRLAGAHADPAGAGLRRVRGVRHHARVAAHGDVCARLHDVHQREVADELRRGQPR